MLQGKGFVGLEFRTFLKLGWSKMWVLCKRAKIRKNNLRISKVLKLDRYASYALNFPFIFQTEILIQEPEKIFPQKK